MLRYAGMRPNVWTVTATGAAASVAACLERVAGAMAIRPDSRLRRAAAVEAAVVERMTASGGLLAVDEAQHLPVRTLEVLRGLHDASGCGVALLGSDPFWIQLSGGRRPEFAQLFSRVGKRVRLTRPGAGGRRRPAGRLGPQGARPGRRRGRRSPPATAPCADSPRRSSGRTRSPPARPSNRAICAPPGATCPASGCSSMTRTEETQVTEKKENIPSGYEAIADLAKRYAAARRALGERVERIREAQRKAGLRLRPGLLTRIEAARAARLDLVEAIESAEHLWKRPRTRTLHGVRVGRRTLPGRLEIDEPTAVLRIRELLPAREKDLVSVRTSLVKAAVKRLDGPDLHAIGGRIEALGDETVVAIARDDLDGLVDALLASLSEEEAEL